jgi:sugar/nucleoside kinase (ribokinase family)
VNPILVVGSVALDSVKTPEGASKEALGGSAVYFSLAARHFAPVRMVGVVGEDFPAEHRQMLENNKIDVSGLETAKGKTFRWVGQFDETFDQAETLDTQLNVFEDFTPKLSEEHKASPILFLANIDPEIQLEVLSQMKGPKLVAADTMNFWISSKKAALKELLSHLDIFFINEEEARQLSGESNNCRAIRKLAEWGPSTIVVKKGEHGALLLAGGTIHPYPAFPLENILDPTGAGDTFGGAFIGAMSESLDLNSQVAMKHALVYGTSMASFTVSGFSTSAVEKLQRKELDARHKAYADMLHLPPLVMA